MSTTYTLDQLNTASAVDALHMLDGLYEHSPWIAQTALEQRPFSSVEDLKEKMKQALAAGGREKKIELICAHPELAGKAMQTNTLTAESTSEQKRAGLTDCSPEELAHIQQLNRAYREKNHFPFVLAVRAAHNGQGYNKKEIIQTLEKRLNNSTDAELDECIRNIHLIVEIRLQDRIA